MQKYNHAEQLNISNVVRLEHGTQGRQGAAIIVVNGIHTLVPAPPVAVHIITLSDDGVFDDTCLPFGSKTESILTESKPSSKKLPSEIYSLPVFNFRCDWSTVVGVSSNIW